MIIRHMTVEDVPQVVQIDQASFTLPWTERSFHYEVTGNNASRCWVVETENREVAAMLVLWLIVDEAHIATIATHPEYRRRGYAKAMLVEALRSAREEGAVSALLEVRAHHSVAQKIYHDLGFVDVGRRASYYRDNGEDAILMTLNPIAGDWL